MTIPWIQVYSNLAQHPKTFALAQGLALQGEQLSPSVMATGMLVGIWSLCAQSAPDGRLHESASAALAAAAGWQGSPETLVDALLAAGLLDREEGSMLHIHNWDNYAILLIDQVQQRKSKTRERVRRYRARQRGMQDATDALPNAPTTPNQTTPDQTFPSATQRQTGRVPRRTVFVKPQAQDIETYCKGAGLCVDAQEFLDYYDARGWMLGKSPMQSWKAVVRNWDRRAKAKAARSGIALPSTLQAGNTRGAGMLSPSEQEMVRLVQAHREARTQAAQAAKETEKGTRA